LFLTFLLSFYLSRFSFYINIPEELKLELSHPERKSIDLSQKPVNFRTQKKHIIPRPIFKKNSRPTYKFNISPQNPLSIERICI